MIKISNEKKKQGILLFLIVGISSTIWFLIRVIPKPTRANYPCMKAAAPFMSGFVVYILSLIGSVIAFKKAKQHYANSKYGAVAIFSTIAVVAVFLVMVSNNPFVSAISTNKSAVADISNTPMGTPKGYWPGRVAWVMDKEATSDYTSIEKWYQKTNASVVSKMLADGIKRYADTSNLKTAWGCLFKYFNNAHGKGWAGYKQGEKIVIKLNHTNLGSGGHTIGNEVCATPELVFALLTQLIDSVGVAQANITIGDPYRGFPDVTYNMCKAKYPNVNYIEGKPSSGRKAPIVTTTNKYFNSDDEFQSRLPQAYIDANYLINLPTLKTHDAAGITIAAKNHQGTVIGTGQNASNQSMGELHYDYPGDIDNRKMGMYRHIVDYMAHSKLGGNTLIYIVDAIWSGRNWNGYIDKFGMDPFSNDYTNSLFISQDAVAIESVGYDFLYNEYKNHGSYHNNDEFPLWEGVQDYIHQAADSANWPDGIVYDPDNSSHSNPFASLGVHEHWNNATDKKYSVNLTGNKGGIELVSVPSNLVASVPINYTHEIGIEVPEEPIGIKNTHVNDFKIWPNPATSLINVSYTITESSQNIIQLFSIDGKLVSILFNKTEPSGYHSNSILINVPKGMYYCKLTSVGKNTKVITTKLIVLDNN